MSNLYNMLRVVKLDITNEVELYKRSSQLKLET